MTYRVWTDDDKAALVKLAGQGKGPDYIASRLKRSPGAVQTMAHGLGISFRDIATRGREEARLAEYHKTKAQLLAIIEQAIADGEPMPRNVDLARQLGLADKCNVNTMMRRLKEEGAIKVKMQGPNRIVTLCETGQSTKSQKRRTNWGGVKPGPAVEPADTLKIEEAKRVLRRAGYSNVYNAGAVHKDQPELAGKYQVGTRLVNEHELLSMAKQAKRKLAA